MYLSLLDLAVSVSKAVVTVSKSYSLEMGAEIAVVEGGPWYKTTAIILVDNILLYLFVRLTGGKDIWSGKEYWVLRF